jgi:hypothetical protein
MQMFVVYCTTLPVAQPVHSPMVGILMNNQSERTRKEQVVPEINVIFAFSE